MVWALFSPPTADAQRYGVLCGQPNRATLHFNLAPLTLVAKLPVAFDPSSLLRPRNRRVGNLHFCNDRKQAVFALRKWSVDLVREPFRLTLVEKVHLLFG